MEEFKVEKSSEVKDGKFISKDTYSGKIALMCPICYDYSIVDYNRNIEFTIDSDVYHNNHKCNLFVTYDGSKYDIDPYIDEGFSAVCPNCGHHTVVAIDPNIIECIYNFNRDGFTTAFCCEGHDTGDGYTRSYITFKDLTKKTIKRISQLVSELKYWEVGNDKLLPFINSNGELIVQSLFINVKDEYCKEEFKEKYLKEIYNLSMYIGQDIKGMKKMRMENAKKQLKASLYNDINKASKTMSIGTILDIMLETVYIIKHNNK